jgi:beta-glucosidase
MKAVRPLCLLLALSLLGAWGAPAARTQRTRRDPVERRIDALIARMTLAEKLGQLQQLDGHADGRYRDEHVEMIRRGALGSTLNVRSSASPSRSRA